MNISNVFKALVNPQQIAVAKITADEGGGTYQAETQGGRVLLLKGSASVGQMVFYDMRTRIITGQAPDISMTDIAV